MALRATAWETLAMRVLITGGAGFIGSHLTRRLLAAGHEVQVLDDLSTGRRENVSGAAAGVPGALAFTEGDIRDADLVARLAQGAEVVFHQAALASVERSVAQPRLVAEVNVSGTLCVLEAARRARVRRVVFASSSSVYGEGAALPTHEDTPLSPCSPYAATKAGGEALFQAYQQTYGLETVSLRYFNVYGPRQPMDGAYAAVIPAFIEACLAGRPLPIQGDGHQTRDFTFVGDLCDAVLLAAEAPAAVAGPINIGAGRSVSILELAQAIGAACGSAPRIEHCAPRTGDVRDSLASVTRVRERLGWTPRTSLAQGLKATVRATLTGAGDRR
jgi:UDP-glucose 4-epimerase